MDKIYLKKPITLDALRAYANAGLTAFNNNEYKQAELALLTGDEENIRILFGTIFMGDWENEDLSKIPVEDMQKALLFFGENGAGLYRGLQKKETNSSQEKADPGTV